MSDDISEQFKDFDINLLIGAPLKAAAEAQLMLSDNTADFISKVCMADADDSNLKTPAGDCSSGRELSDGDQQF